MERMSRKDAAKALVREFDDALVWWKRAHPEKLESPDWHLPLAMPLPRIRAIVDALRPLAED